MAGNQPPEGHGIVPKDDKRELIIPAEMINRGLELAISIERQLGNERYTKPILKFPGALNRSCVNFSGNGNIAAITSHGNQKDNPGLVIWNMVNRALSIYPEAGFRVAAPYMFFLENIPSDEQMGLTKESSPISDIKISVTEANYKPIGDPDSKPWDIYSVVLSLAGDVAMIGYGDGCISTCVIENGVIKNFVVIRKDPSGRQVGSIALSPDNQIIAASIGHIVHVWEFGSGKEIQQIEGYNPFYNQLAFSNDGAKLLVAKGLGKNGWTSCLTLLDVRGNKPPVVCCNNRIMSTSAVSISPDNQILFSLDDGRITLWDATSGKEMTHWNHTRAEVNDVLQERQLSRDLKFGMIDPTIWGLSSVAVSPDCKRVLSGGGDNFMRLWSLSGHMLWEFPHDSRVVKVAFHPDGNRAMAGCWNGSVYIWDLP